MDNGHLLLRMEEAAPGLAFLAAATLGDDVYVFVRLYFYGNNASAVAMREEPAWRAWMDEHFSRRSPV